MSLAVVVKMKKQMTMQNQQKSNANLKNDNWGFKPTLKPCLNAKS
mgnify:CR=1 FL=1